MVTSFSGSSGATSATTTSCADKAIQLGDFAQSVLWRQGQDTRNIVQDLPVEDGLRAHFAALRGRRAYDEDDVARGREYVRAYVEFISYVERIHESATATAEGHYPEPKSNH